MAQCKKIIENDKAFQEGKKDKKIQKLRTDGEEEIHLLMKKLNEDNENVKKQFKKNATNWRTPQLRLKLNFYRL